MLSPACVLCQFCGFPSMGLSSVSIKPHSVPLLFSSSSKCSGIPLLLLLLQPTMLLCLLSTGLLCTAHPSITVFPWTGSTPPTLPVSVRSCLSRCAVISRLLTMFWICYLDICCLLLLFLMSFPIVFSLNHSAPPSLFPSLLKSFPGPSFMSSMETHFISSRCCFFFFLLPICFPFTALWPDELVSDSTHSFQSLKNVLHS